MPERPPSEPTSTHAPEAGPDAKTSYLLGNAFRLEGDPVRAEAALGEALRLSPEHFEARSSLAYLYYGQGRQAEAVQLFYDWLASGPDDVSRLIQVALFLEEIQGGEVALACLERAIRLAPGRGEPWFLHGRLLLEFGRFDPAMQSFERALQNDPDLDTAYLQLAHARRFGPKDPLIPFFIGQATHAERSESTRACLGFALGKIYDDLEQWDEALKWIESANALRRRTVRFDSERCRNIVLERLSAPPHIWDPPAPLPRESAEPLFIVGLPRSGSTLLERLLLEHPAIVSAGELPTLPDLISNTHLIERWREGEHAGLPSLGAELAALRACYREELMRAAAAPQASNASPHYVIDKNPLNFFHVGVIRRLFPNAPILALERDPRDVLISLYFHDFAHPDLAFSYSIEHLLFFLHCHETLMPLWKTIATIHLRTVRYETLVTEPATVVQALLNFLALPPLGEPETRSLAPNLIATVSAWQARQPIYGRSAGRWERYAPGLLRAHPELRTIGFTP